jgi:hypothetical protein
MVARGIIETWRTALIFGFLIFALKTEAQEKVIDEQNEWAYSLKGGINFAELVGDDALPLSRRKVGYSLGFAVSMPLKKGFYFSPEFLWSVQGESSESNGKYTLNYLNVPLLLKWKEKKFYSELGLQMGFITISSEDGVPEEYQLEEDLESFELALNAGVGYAIFEDLSIGLRYTHGITTIVEGYEIWNSVIYVGIAYKVF